MEADIDVVKGDGGGENGPGCSGYSSMVHSKKVIKHALRQQAKRRRKNTTIAAGNSRTLPRIVVKPLPPPPPNDPPSPVNNVQHINSVVEEPAATMREVLASLPGFSFKSGRRRSTKRLSAAAQLEAGLVDLESPASILASTSLRALLNRHTFQGLPPLYQRKLAQLLPAVDRQDAATSGLNNEFFARACLEWRKRLAEGEFTPENQQRLKMEAERDKNKLDPWKLKHFEPIWGEKRDPKLRSGLHCIEPRSVGAVTRSSLRLRHESNVDQIMPENPRCLAAVAEEKIEVICIPETIAEVPENVPSTQEIQQNLLPEYEDSVQILEDENLLQEHVSVNINPEEVIKESIEEVEENGKEDGKQTSRNKPELVGEITQEAIQDNQEVSQELREEIVEEVSQETSESIEEIEEIHEIHEVQEPEEEISESMDVSQTDEVSQSEEVSQIEVQVQAEKVQIQSEEIVWEKIQMNPQIQELHSEETECLSHVSDEISQTSEECISQTSEDPSLQFSKEQFSQLSGDQIYQLESDNNSASPQDQDATCDLITDDSEILINQGEVHEMQSEIQHEIQHEIQSGIQHEMQHEIQHEIKYDIHQEVKYEIQHEVQHEIQHEIQHEVQTEMHTEIRTEMQTDMQADLPVEMQASIQNDIQSEIQVDMQGSNEHTADPEPQIPEGMEIDIETLQRIHELEVRGEMREAYEEISGCPEEIIYPILEGMEIGSTGEEEPEASVVAGPVEDVTVQEVRHLAVVNEDEALREANNYVCSEMLECSWAVDPNVGAVSSNPNTRTQEELQVSLPLVAAALDGSVAANITVTTQEECSDTSTTTDSTNPSQFISTDAHTESINCIQLPVVQSAPFQSETLAIGTPVTNCLMKNMQQSQSSPIIAFPQLQSIRFVQTNFHSGHGTTQTLNSGNALPPQIQSQQNPQQQVSIVRPHEEIVQIGTQGNVVHNNLQNSVQNPTQDNNLQTTVSVQSQNHAQSAIVIQHQTQMAAQPRQIVATLQPQQQQQQQQQQQPQQYPAVTIASRPSRSTQGGQRSRGSNKEQGGRSRSSTKEPPGAVNLERSYQICQAVIQSSPNRDQLKAHLKPPPSLLARGDGAFTTTKSGGRTITTVKTQKSQNSTSHNKQAQSKGQAVMLRHVFTTARQTAPAEVTDSNAVTQIGSNGNGGLGQYILVQRTGVGDGAPRASSAPPLPPQIAGMGVGVHLVRGRPASAGEGSHQAVTLKARGALDGRGGGGAEPGAPGVIMGGDPPPPWECNMRGAMVICRQCGAFCHDDCIGPQRICATCLIR